MPALPHRRLALSLLLAAACGGDASSGPLSPVPGRPPAVPTPTTWRAVALEAGALPATAYEFPDEPVTGGATRFRVDSAALTLRADGTYERRTWFSEWQSLDVAGAAPFQLMYRAIDYDHGNWRRSGGALHLGSEWIEDQTHSGTFTVDGRLTLMLGLTPGDPLFAVRFAAQ